MLDITRPYSKVTFEFLVNELLMPQPEVESLLVEMILDRRLDATIDQVREVVLFDRSPPSTADRELEKLARLADVLTLASSKLCFN